MQFDARTLIRIILVTLSSTSVTLSAARAAQKPPRAASASTSKDSAVHARPDAEPRFTVREFLVLGNHLLPQTAVERAVYPFLGEDRDLDTVKAAAAALEKVYKDAGYGTTFVNVPPQHVANGVVRLQVTEGVLDRVRVRGERYFSERQIRAALPALQTGKTPNLIDLQRQLARLDSRTPDRVVTPVLTAGPEPGTVDIDLLVKDKLPLHGSLQYDDRHTADTTPNRLTAALSYDNLWQRQDSVGIQYQTAPADTSNAQVLSADYLGHIGSGIAALSYIHTRSNVLALGTLGVLGSGDIYGLHWVQPLPGTPAMSQGLNLGMDYKDVQTEVFPAGTTSGASGIVTAPVRYLNWSAVYSQNRRFARGTLGLSASLQFGVRSLINSVDQFENARYNATPDYVYLRASSNATQALPGGLGLLERVSGQWSPDALVNNEQFALGGADSVRGYLEAETLGDSGAAASLEVHSPTPGDALGSMLRPLYGFVFIDAGVASLVDPLPGQAGQVTLWSVGVGARLENTTGLSASLDYAVPQRDGIRTRKDEGRIDFLIRYAF
jgi:hemolysin activation/secretion protein